MSSMFRSTSFFIRQPKLLGFFQLLFGLSLAYFAGFLLHYHYYMLTYPYPIMYREADMMVTPAMLLHGANPYNFVMEPQYSDLYGIVYPLFVLPLVKLFGQNLLIYRAVTAFFIFASCWIISLVLHKKKAPLLLNLWAVLTLYASLLYPLTTTPCIDPASTGLFFMLLTIFIPYFLNYSYLSLVLSILCGLLAFYTKSYFILGLPVMVSYLFFFISTKRSIFYGFFSLACFSFSALAMSHYFPSYFDDCFFVNYNISARTTMIIVLHKQLSTFAGLHQGIIILLMMVSAYGLGRLFLSDRTRVIKDLLKSCKGLLRFKDWDSPLITREMPLDVYAGICFAAVLWLSMGRHLGANLWYFFQLFSPFLVTIVAWVAGRFTLWPLVFSCLLLYNLFSLSAKDDYLFFDMKNARGWDTLEMLVRSNDTIFNSSLIAPLLIKYNKEVFDDGTEFYGEGGYRKGWLGRFFKEDKRVSATEALYLDKVQNMMKNKKFDLIIIEAGYPFKIIPQSMANYYKYVGPILVMVPQDRKFYMMTVWKPI